MANLRITLTDVQDFGVSSAPEYFGSEQGRFRDTITYNITCYKVDVTNSNGVSQDVVSNLNNLRLTQDYAIITLENGQEFHNAKLIDFSIEESTFTDYGLASLTFEKYGSRATNQMDSSLYNCFNQTIGTEEYQTYFESFNESFDFDYGKDSTTYNYTLDVQLRDQAGNAQNALAFPVNFPFLKNINGSKSIKLARQFAYNIFTCSDRPDIPNLILPPDLSGIYQSGFKKNYNENIDLVTNRCSFTESFNTTNILGAQSEQSAHGLTFSNQITRAENNVINVTENGSIKGLGINFELNSPYASATGALDNELAAATGRMAAAFNRFKVDGDLPLNSGCGGGVKIFSQEITRDPFNGTIEYSVSANNDQKFSGMCSGGSVQVEDTFTLEPTNYSGLSRTVNIVGYGVEISGKDGTAEIVYPKFEKARDIMTGIYKLYNSGEGYAPSPISENWDYDKRNGGINLQFEFSSSPIYRYNSPASGIKKVEVSYDQTNSLPKYNLFQGLNLGLGREKIDQIIQPMNYDLPQSMSVGVNLVRSRDVDSSSTQDAVLEGLVNFATGQIFTDEVFGVEDKKAEYILQSTNYNYTPLNNITLGMQVDFIETSGTEINMSLS